MMPRPLTIAVDIRHLQTAKTGTKTYLEEICKAFKNINDPIIRFHFIDTNIPVYTGNNKIFTLVEHGRYQLWKQIVLPVKCFFKRCDVIFCVDNVVPIIHLGYKTIPVFHDAFFFENPENYGKPWLWLYKKTAIPAAKKSAFIITPTTYAKQQLNKYIHLPNHRLVVIPEGPKTSNNNMSGSAAAKLLASFNLTKGNYLLHAGSMFKRKNIPALIKAFAQVKKDGNTVLKLVLAGPVPANKIDSDEQLINETIIKNNLVEDVIITGYLTDDDLNLFYDNALAYVFPSINEGFGIPILEAFKHNLPVLVANNTCLPEVGGDAVLQFDPFDVNDIASKIKMVLDDAALRQDMINKGQERLKYFSWHNTAAGLIEVFKRAI